MKDCRNLRASNPLDCWKDVLDNVLEKDQRFSFETQQKIASLPLNSGTKKCLEKSVNLWRGRGRGFKASPGPYLHSIL